jgi:hypothetical protein
MKNEPPLFDRDDSGPVVARVSACVSIPAGARGVKVTVPALGYDEPVNYATDRGWIVLRWRKFSPIAELTVDPEYRARSGIARQGRAASGFVVARSRSVAYSVLSLRPRDGSTCVVR